MRQRLATVRYVPFFTNTDLKLLSIIAIIGWNSFQLFPQTKKLFIQIDTIDYQDRVSLIGKFYTDVTNQGFLEMGERFDSTDILSTYSSPHYTNTIYIRTDSSAIELPIDLNGSIITVNNVYNISSDSIRINKLQMFNTSPPDTIFTRRDCYKAINGEVSGKPLEVKFTTTFSEPVPPPTSIYMTINGIRYQTSLTLTKSNYETISTGHSYAPQNYRKKNGNFKKRTRYYHYMTTTRNYIWTGEIRLKNGT